MNGKWGKTDMYYFMKYKHYLCKKNLLTIGNQSIELTWSYNPTLHSEL